MKTYDLVIIGTGMGGGALAYALRDSGRKILLLERGDYLPAEPENWEPEAIFTKKRYKPNEQWFDDSGHPFPPGVHYFVGGNTKVYGAALPRFRKEDFEDLEHEEGVSPAWPVKYQEFEPYYCRAEQMLFVHGEPGHDPTEPRTASFPFPPVPHEPYIEDLKRRIEHQGLHPFFLPLGIDLRPGGKCIRCKTCDGFPCKVHAKADADCSCIRPALASNKNIELMTRALVRRLITSSSGKRVTEAEIEHDGQTLRIGSETFVVSCGAVNSTALLLRSASTFHPNGLANSSGLVGRNYMVHNHTALMAVNPFRINPTTFQKTMAVNDFYFHGDEGYRFPQGNLQLLGKLQAGMLTANQRWVPKPILAAFAHRSVDWWVMSEDLPDPQNRMTPANLQPKILSMANTETTKLEASSASSTPVAVKLRRILVSVYLETSAAIDYALELAKIPGTHFVLPHVIETPRSERNLGAFASEENKAKLEFRREQALHHLEAVCEKFQAAGAPCTPNVRIGIPHDEILNEAAVIAPDLIIVGSTATAAFTRFLLGSTAERVVRHATCSVFVARREQT